MMKRIFYAILLCVLTPAVFAAPSFFEPSQNDQSMYYLAAIFGNVGNLFNNWSGPSPSTLMPYVFTYFNNAVIVLGCILILYTLLVSTINTAHQGEALGQKWNSVWIPMRTALGFALLLPVKTLGIAQGGLAVIQVMIMWVIIQGVGAADYIWTNMVEKIVAGDADISFNTANATDLETANSIFQYMVCSIGYMESQQLKDYYTNEEPIKHSDYKDADQSGPGCVFTDDFYNKDYYAKSDYMGCYGQAAPKISYQITGGKANMPNMYVWGFGSSNPNDWSRASICGYVTLPTGAGGSQALKNYYARQANLINQMIGLGGYPRGVYGGNWSGIYPTDGLTQDDSKASGGTNSAAGVGLVTQNGKGVKLPTLGYLADYYMVYLDSGSVPLNPSANSTSNRSGDTETCTDDNGNPAPCNNLPSSGAEDYTVAQLQSIAKAYALQTQANYKTYLDESQADTSSSLSQQKDNLSSAAKYNGWASAGAFFIDMVKALNTSTSNMSATTYDYSYAALACQNGVGITDAGSDRRCQDARSPTDIQGIFRKTAGAHNYTTGHFFHQGWTPGHHAYGRTAGNNVSKVLLGEETLTLQALGQISDLSDDSDDDDDNTDNSTPMCITTIDSTGKQTTQCSDTSQTPTPSYNTGNQNQNCQPLTDNEGRVIRDSTGAPVQRCGIYNSAMNSNPAFQTNNFVNPKFPKWNINPLVWYGYVNDKIMYNFAQTLQPIMSMGTGGKVENPILTLRKAGIRLLNTSSQLYHIGFKYMWVSGLVSYTFSGVTGIGNAMASAMTWGSATYTAIISVMMGMGAMMAYYFPLIPYLIFTFAFIQWLILTIEAMTAAPLLCLGILYPEGQHEVFGHSSMGIAILSSVFLRPSLMIIGYFAATVMSYVVVLIINGGFFFAANSLLGGADSAGGGAASMFGTLIIWGMYVNTLMVVLNKAFSLIYHIPDHIMRWIGIQEERGGVEQMLGDVQKGVSQGAETGQKAGSALGKSQAETMHGAGGLIQEGKSGAVAGGGAAYDKIKGK